MLAEALTHHHQTIRVHLISTPMWDGVVLHPMHHLQPHIPGPSTCIIFSPIFHCSQEPCTLQTRHPHHAFISPSPSSPIILPNSTLKYRPPQFLASKLRANPMSCNQALDGGCQAHLHSGPLSGLQSFILTANNAMTYHLTCYLPWGSNAWLPLLKTEPYIFHCLLLTASGQYEDKVGTKWALNTL